MSREWLNQAILDTSHKTTFCDTEDKSARERVGVSVLTDAVEKGVEEPSEQ
jgi:hypothetical protein